MTATLNQPIEDTGAEFVEVDHTLATQLLKDYAAAKAAETKAKAKVAAAKARILEVMSGADVLRDDLTGQELVVNRTVTSHVFDSTAFRAAHPALAVSYMKTQASRPFKVLG